jgi:hypothetical protein
VHVIKSFEVLLANICQKIIIVLGLGRQARYFVKSDVAPNMASDNKNILLFIYPLNIQACYAIRQY